MGYEGFSKPWRMSTMDPIIGNKKEFIFLAILFPTILLLKAARMKNEDGVRDALGHANNRYAHFVTVKPSA